MLKDDLQEHQEALLIYTSHEEKSEDFADAVFEISENKITKVCG